MYIQKCVCVEGPDPQSPQWLRFWYLHMIIPHINKLESFIKYS